MAVASTQEITQLLKAWGGGDKAALDEPTRLCYEELRRIARRHMRREHSGHTLQTSALVNEAFLRLTDWKNCRVADRAHSFARVATIEKELFWSAPSLAATGDGRWILYVRTDRTESDIMLVENFS